MTEAQQFFFDSEANLPQALHYLWEVLNGDLDPPWDDPECFYPEAKEFLEGKVTNLKVDLGIQGSYSSLYSSGIYYMIKAILRRLEEVID